MQSYSLEKWHEETARIDRLTDGLGMPIDKGIRNLVVALKCHGFETRQSCEGHSDRALPYPWVSITNNMIGDKKADNLMLEFLSEYRDTKQYKVLDRDAEVKIDREDQKTFRIMSRGGEFLTQLPREILTLDKCTEILKRYQKEMNRFAAFLEVKYLEKVVEAQARGKT